MEVSWTCYGQEDKSTVLYGTQGCLKINSDTKYPWILERRSRERIYYNMDDYKGHRNGTGMVDTWIHCLKTKTPPEISGESSFESMKAVFAALESAEKGCMISVNNLEKNLTSKLFQMCKTPEKTISGCFSRSFSSTYIPSHLPLTSYPGLHIPYLS